MGNDSKRDIERARNLFYNWNLLGAYAIYKRLFDRLPFEVQSAHCESIGYFLRTLLELGKEYELKFYLGEIERLYQLQKSPELGYQLATVYATGPTWCRNYPDAKLILQKVLKTDLEPLLSIRSKMMLAYIYDSESNDIASCRKIIESIEIPIPSENEELFLLNEIWKAKILRDEKQFGVAEKKLVELLENEKLKHNWYAYFSCKNILAILYLRTEKIEEASRTYNELKEFFRGKKLNVTQRALQLLENEIRQNGAMGTVFARIETDSIDLVFGKQRHRITIKKDVERLFHHFLKAKVANREDILRVIHDREYEKKDDKTVYYYVHQLRKYLVTLGFPEKALVLEGTGYRFIPEVRCEII